MESLAAVAKDYLVWRCSVSAASGGCKPGCFRLVEGNGERQHEEENVEVVVEWLKRRGG